MANLTTAPVLSTPESYALKTAGTQSSSYECTVLSEEQIRVRYEIDKTVQDIRAHNWKRIALQFPDRLLPHSARVSRLLEAGLKTLTPISLENGESEHGNSQNIEAASRTSDASAMRITILGDTSYGSCCVDEIAAEHVDAEVVVHYGRACLSPTARLPVLYVFTKTDLDIAAAADAFSQSFPDLESKVIVTADIPFASHVQEVCQKLSQLGYRGIFPADIVHDPSSVIPNRTIPADVQADRDVLGEWSLFHIAEPPTSLLLTIASKVKSIEIHIPVNREHVPDEAQQFDTSRLLRRRYALVTSMNTVSTWGILINTLSVKNYLHIVDHVKEQIAASGKKSYLFVVGKLNAAKVANFSEIGGWVVIGCWESSLIDSRDFYKPILTPFELDLALKEDNERVWTGAWCGDFQGVLDRPSGHDGKIAVTDTSLDASEEAVSQQSGTDSDEESEPPEFDLRTGKYVSRTRPMNRRAIPTQTSSQKGGSMALTKQHKGDMIKVNGVLSPAAEFLAQKRTWVGLGSDFKIEYDEENEVQGSLIEEGRTGMARGYVVGNSIKS